MLIKKKVSILLTRSSLYMDGVDIYREGSIYDASRNFIIAVYLQTKIVKIGKN